MRRRPDFSQVLRWPDNYRPRWFNGTLHANKEGSGTMLCLYVHNTIVWDGRVCCPDCERIFDAIMDPKVGYTDV